MRVESLNETASVSEQAPPTLSVVVPVFNVEPWISECIRSIQAQTVDAMQIIVVDDGSTDRTWEILAELAQQDPRLILLHNTGKGSAAARNLGVASATARYLAFADGDDIVPQGAYSALIASLGESDSDLAMGDYLTFTATKTWRRNSNLPLYATARTGITIEDEPRLFRDRVCWNKVYRLDWWKWNCIEFADSLRSNDISAMTRVFALASMDIVPVTTYLYRRRPDNSSMTSRRGESQSIVQHLQQEVSCLKIVLNDCSGTVQMDYILGILKHDVWALIPFVVDHSLRKDASDNAEFAHLTALLTEIIQAAPPHVRRLLSPQQRWAYELIEAGEVGLMSLVPGQVPAAESWKRAAGDFPESLVKYGRWSAALGESAKNGLTEVLANVLIPGLAAEEADLTDSELASRAGHVLVFQRTWVPRKRLGKSLLRVLDAIGGNQTEIMRSALRSQLAAPLKAGLRFSGQQSVEIVVDRGLLQDLGEVAESSLVAVSSAGLRSEVRFKAKVRETRNVTFSVAATALSASPSWDLQIDPGPTASGAPQPYLVPDGALPASPWHHRLYATVTKSGTATLTINVKPSLTRRAGILVRGRLLHPQLAGKFARYRT